MRPARLLFMAAAAVPVALLSASACGRSPAPKETGTAATPDSSAATATAAPVTTAIDAAAVANATLAGVLAAPITLKDGVYEGASAGPTADVDTIVVLLPSLVRLGELDAHDGPEAAALVVSNSGRNAERLLLTVVGRVDGKPVSLGTALVGDRVRARDLRVSGRQVLIDVVENGPGEEPCCGTQLSTRTFRLDGTTLTQVAADVTGRLSLASTVAGPAWSAVALDGEGIQATVGAAAVAPTLTVADGRFSGSTGCNQYSASVTEPKPGTLAVGAATSSRKACAGPAGTIERQFLGALAKATSYTFLAGRLVLSGLDGEQMRTITLTRSE